MKINLRKAASIVKTLQYTTLSTLHANVNLYANLQLNALNADNDAKYQTRKTDFEVSIEKVIVATQVLYVLRQLVNAAKEASGINNCLCQVESLQSQIGFLERFVPKIDESSDVKFEGIKTQFAAHLANPESRAYSGSTSLRLELSETNQQYVSTLKKELKKVKDETLLQLNLQTTIELSEELVVVLTGLDLL